MLALLLLPVLRWSNTVLGCLLAIAAKLFSPPDAVPIRVVALLFRIKCISWKLVLVLGVRAVVSNEVSILFAKDDGKWSLMEEGLLLVISIDKSAERCLFFLSILICGEEKESLLLIILPPWG